MEMINFVGIEPTTLIQEIKTQVINDLLPELTKLLQNNSPEYLSAEQICERFSVTKPTIHEWRKRGILKSYKLGARVYYRMDEIENAMIIND